MMMMKMMTIDISGDNVPERCKTDLGSERILNLGMFQEGCFEAWYDWESNGTTTSKLVLRSRFGHRIFATSFSNSMKHSVNDDDASMVCIY